MANFSKAFNFRGGFQVDTDVLVVRGQNVGIGSTIPNERLVVDGIIQAKGLDVSSQETVAIQTASVGFLSATLIHSGVTSISNGIVTSSTPTGVVTYYGDGGRLLNLPTSQWLDVDVGLGFTSIYSQGNVGVDTSDPRFVFQVGGVPYPKSGFNTPQEGVGIETGNIWASGDIQTRGNVSVAQTTTSGQFVGMGSGITALNASNLGVGSIPSNIYGDEIYTGTVYGDLVGTATTAASIELTADLEFDTASARQLQASERVFTPNGRLQVGSDTGTAVGNIDVRKTGAAKIIAVSDNSNAQVIVGRNRPAGTNIEHGGIRFGGDIPLSPESKVNDLDIVNYDIGNVNTYLHASTTGVTTGSFQWIHGRGGNRVLATLDQYGGFSLAGHSTSTQQTLFVDGKATFEDNLTTRGSFEVEQGSILRGNVEIQGDLTLGGSIGVSTDSLVLPSTSFNGNVEVGPPPELGGGVRLEFTGLVAANELKIFNGATESFSVTQGGAVDAQGIGCTGLFSEILVQSPRFDGEDYSGNNGFFVTTGDAGFDSLRVAGTIEAGLGKFTDLDVPDIEIDNLTVNNGVNINSAVLTGSGGNLTVGGNVSAVNLLFQALSPEPGTEITVTALTTGLQIGVVANVAGTPVNRIITLPYD